MANRLKVVLVNAPVDLGRILGPGSVFVDPGEPTGILYVAAYLRQHNPDVDVSVLDAFQRDLTVEQTCQDIAARQPDIVGISCVTANGSDAFRLGKRLKEDMPDTLVVLGNMHPVFFKETYLGHDACDLIVEGEGEITMHEITGRVRAGRRDFDDIRGLYHKRDGVICATPPRDPMDIGALPFPARDLIDITEYPAYKQRVCIIHGSRGCTFRCRFCVVPKNGYRYRAADDIIEEMIHCKETYGFDYFLFFDPLFGGNKKQGDEFCQKMIATGLNKEVRWSCEVHVNLITQDRIKLWRTAGLSDVAFGIESGNNEILRIANKSSKIETICKAVQLARDVGLRTIVGLFILGLPGDTEETILETIRFARKLPLDDAQFTTFMPYPGSPFYDDLLADGYFDVDFDDLESLLPWWDRFSAYTAFTENQLPIYTPPGITPLRLKQLQRRAFREFYFSPKRVLKRAKLFGIRRTLRQIRPALALFRKVPRNNP